MILCSKQFSVKADLDLHTPIHSDVKVRQCKLCGKQFSRVSSLSIHMKTHNTKVKDKIPCTICSASFSKKPQLWKHIRDSHKFDHTCEFCGRSFEKVRLLRIHRKVHAVNKNYVCPICPEKKYCENHLLRRHLKDRHPGVELPPVIKLKDRIRNKYNSLFEEVATEQT